MQSRFLLNVVICQRPAILKLLSSKDKALLIRRNSFLILDLALDILNGVRALDFKGDSFPRQGLHKHLHTTTQTKHQMQSRFLLNVVICQRPAILKLLSSKDKALLIRRNSFLILDLALDILNGVRALDFKGDSFPRQGLHKNLHSTTNPQTHADSGILRDIVILDKSVFIKDLASEFESREAIANTLLAHDPFLHIRQTLCVFDQDSVCLARHGLYKKLAR